MKIHVVGSRVVLCRQRKTNMMKLIIAFRYFADAPNIWHIDYTRATSQINNTRIPLRRYRCMTNKNGSAMFLSRGDVPDISRTPRIAYNQNTPLRPSLFLSLKHLQSNINALLWTCKWFKVLLWGKQNSNSNTSLTHTMLYNTQNTLNGI